MVGEPCVIQAKLTEIVAYEELAKRAEEHLNEKGVLP
jgi:hypothetical protein